MSEAGAADVKSPSLSYRYFIAYFASGLKQIAVAELKKGICLCITSDFELTSTFSLFLLEESSVCLPLHSPLGLGLGVGKKLIIYLHGLVYCV